MLIFASNSVVNLTDRAGSRIKTKQYESKAEQERRMDN